MFSCCNDKFPGVYKLSSVVYIFFNGKVSEQIADANIKIIRLNKVLGAYSVSVQTKIQIGPNLQPINFDFIAFLTTDKTKILGSTNLSDTIIEIKNGELIFINTARLGDNAPSIGSKSIKVERLLVDEKEIDAELQKSS